METIRGSRVSEQSKERAREIENMTPTRNEEIEGRPYKDYAYSPVPVSSSSAVFDAVTPGKETVELSTEKGKESCRTSFRVVDNYRPEDMTEKGSKLVQFLAAAAGKSVFQN